MSNLITRERAQRNLAQASFTAAENKLIDALVAAASAAIQKWCRRNFALGRYDEVHNGNGACRLLLDHFPVAAVERVAHDPRTVLRLRNTSATNQRATVQVTATGLTLQRVASGTTSTDSSVNWANNATLSAVAAAVSALGNGWAAEVTHSEYSNRASADLRPIQGALNAKDAWAGMKLHVQELSDYEVDAQRGWLLRPTAAEFLQAFGDSTGDGGWFGGQGYWRVLYTAGFAAVPEEVQEACAEWTALLYWQAKRDPGLVQEAIPGAVSRTATGDLPVSVKQLLTPYRNHRILGW
jgi:hypothetical protein